MSTAARAVANAAVKTAKVALDVLGKIWTLPNTIIGLILGLVQLPFGASISIEHNAIVFNNAPIASGSEAWTLGNVIFNHPNRDINRQLASPYTGQQINVGTHEEGHTYQYEVLGPLFFPIWLILGGPSSNNPLETAADTYATTQKGWFP